MKLGALEMRRRLPAAREAWSGALVIGRSCSQATTREKNLADKSYLLRKGERQLHANYLPHCVSHSLWYGIHQQRHQSAMECQPQPSSSRLRGLEPKLWHGTSCEQPTDWPRHTKTAKEGRQTFASTAVASRSLRLLDFVH
jgi:hypothetical protein